MCLCCAVLGSNIIVQRHCYKLTIAVAHTLLCVTLISNYYYLFFIVIFFLLSIYQFHSLSHGLSLTTPQTTPQSLLELALEVRVQLSPTLISLLITLTSLMDATHMSSSSNDTVIDRLNPDTYSLSPQQPQTSQANPQLSQARLTPPSSSHQQFSFRPQFQFSQPSQQLFPTCCNSHSQPGGIAEPTPNVTPMIHDDNLF